MSRFYASIQGSRGEVTRCGSATSGITGHVHGWDLGIRVEGVEVDGRDEFRVYRTSGSNESAPDVLLFTVTDTGQRVP